ncbi:hypothetical protein [Geitlerinema sp. PCC 9228]|uniref:type II toxin-antitoxin system HicB family antitoxin n=1 Tax=Geitlerinema sp. PCC 9228 TaxID=111611 RepID=UPI0008F9D324|nr:hypothetical protein [Geitlerinema sp. PCC 9228]
MKPVTPLTAIIEREGDGFVSLCLELDVASQGETARQAWSNLIEALELFFEYADASEVRRRYKRIFRIVDDGRDNLGISTVD